MLDLSKKKKTVMAPYLKFLLFSSPFEQKMMIFNTTFPANIDFRTKTSVYDLRNLDLSEDFQKPISVGALI
jgi:hypothetical protein